VDDERYIELATAVMDAAKELPFHPGPLDEAISHIQMILKISADTLESYNEEKRKNALIDFSDMVHIANSILD
jgi:ATP-dependent exoDNAse (exonuclease V) beta subunit